MVLGPEGGVRVLQHKTRLLFVCSFFPIVGKRGVLCDGVKGWGQVTFCAMELGGFAYSFLGFLV